MQSEACHSDHAPPLPHFDGPPPRPAPTAAYSYKEYNISKPLYIRCHQQANLELAKLGSGPQILGFDLEWKPNFRKGQPENPVALVQLSNYNTVFLLQISAMKDFPSQLAQVLANPSIVKAGVGIQDDAKKLYRDYEVPMSNCVDLSLLARTVDTRLKAKYNNGNPLGLARLIELYEYRLLLKGKTARSNWEEVLSRRQIEYASNDAHAGYVLYKKLMSMIPSLQDPPRPDWHSFDVVPNYDSDPDVDEPPFPSKVPRPPRLPSAADVIEGSGTSQNDDFSRADTNRAVFLNTVRACTAARLRRRGSGTSQNDDFSSADTNRAVFLDTVKACTAARLRRRSVRSPDDVLSNVFATIR